MGVYSLFVVKRRRKFRGQAVAVVVLFGLGCKYVVLHPERQQGSSNANT